MFSNYKKTEVLNLVKRIQKTVGLNKCNIVYCFTKDFTSNCTPMIITLRNDLNPTKIIEKIYESYGLYDYFKKMDI